MLFDDDDDEKSKNTDEGTKCFRCSCRFIGSPRDHNCYDGTTFVERLAELASKKHDKELNHYNILILTPQDEKLLRGMKIRWDNKEEYEHRTVKRKQPESSGENQQPS